MNKREMLDALVRSGLYLVTEDGVPSVARLSAVESAVGAGARMVQLRDKVTPAKVLLSEAREMKRLCNRAGAAFIVNDDAALAWSCDADGVHLGQDDLPVEEARRLLGASKLIGVSISTVEEAIDADSAPADYIGVGAIFATPTKMDAELGGLELLRAVRRITKKPLVAIGGIDSSNAGLVFEAGADAVAVVRAAFAPPDVAGAVRHLLEIASASRARRESGD